MNPLAARTAAVFAAISLLACTPKAETALENHTGERILIIVQYVDGERASGELDGGASLMLPEKLDEVRFVEFKGRARTCHMETQTLKKLARRHPHTSFDSVPLTWCD